MNDGGVVVILIGLVILYFPLSFLRKGEASIASTIGHRSNPGDSTYGPTEPEFPTEGETYSRATEPAAFWATVGLLLVAGAFFVGCGVYMVAR